MGLLSDHPAQRSAIGWLSDSDVIMGFRLIRVEKEFLRLEETPIMFLTGEGEKWLVSYSRFPVQLILLPSVRLCLLPVFRSADGITAGRPIDARVDSSGDRIR